RFVLKTILQLQLRMRGKAVACCHVDSSEILAPAKITSCAVVNAAEKLLVPTKRAEELRCDFIFGLQIVSERIRIADSRDLKARFIKFRPHLQVMPGETDVLS